MREFAIFWLGTFGLGSYFTWVFVILKSKQLVRRIRAFARTRKAKNG